MPARHSSEHHVTRSRWELRCDITGCTRPPLVFDVEDATGTRDARAERVVARSHEVAGRNDWRVEVTPDGDERHICPGPHTG